MIEVFVGYRDGGFSTITFEENSLKTVKEDRIALSNAITDGLSANGVVNLVGKNKSLIIPLHAIELIKVQVEGDEDLPA